MGTSRGAPGIAAALVSLSHSLRRFSQPEVIWTSLPSNGILGWVPGMGLGPLGPLGYGGTSTAEISSLSIFNGHTSVWDRFHVSALPASLEVASSSVCPWL